MSYGRAATRGFSKLYLTDFDRLEFVATEDMLVKYKCDESKIGEETALDIMLSNLDGLKAFGCEVADDGMLINHVSGFSKEATDPSPPNNPDDIIPPGCTVGLLTWGSPRGNPSACTNAYHGSENNGASYKTDAFESMSWLVLTLSSP